MQSWLSLVVLQQFQSLAGAVADRRFCVDGMAVCRLDRNHLVSVPRELGGLSELQELYLDHNQVRCTLAGLYGWVLFVDGACCQAGWPAAL